MKIRIAIATHKKYWMPKDACYLPVQAGAEGKESLGYQGDNTGEHISHKNSHFCELTVLYWLWKNVNADYYGLAHYRRHFIAGKRNLRGSKAVLSEKQWKKLFAKTDIVLPKKRRYYIESLYSHYEHTHYKRDLEAARNILKDFYPEYVKAFDATLQKTSGHMFNMFVMKKEIFQEYCEWLFSILFELEKRIDVSEYDEFQARVFGRISELLFNVWLERKAYEYLEVPISFLGKIDWVRKIFSFLKAKFFNIKYNKSF